MDSINLRTIILWYKIKNFTSFSEVLSLSLLLRLCQVNHFQDSIFWPFMILDFEKVSLYKMREVRLIHQVLDIFD